MNSILKLTLGVLLVSLVSCNSDDRLPNDDTPLSYDENSIAKKLKFIDVNSRISDKQNRKAKKLITIVIVRWDEWGRASKDCKGWELCNADWFPDFNQTNKKATPKNGGGATLLEYDESQAKYYIDVLLAETVPSDMPLEALTLKIDKDFELDVEEAISKKLTFNEGNYTFDNTLGEFGGYRIYLD